jgi:hypothetical protein
MATRKVSVTSVTPRATVTARTKAQQARTRKLVGTIAAVTPVGRLATGAIKASRTTGIAGFGAAKTPAQNFGKYAQISDVKSKTARKIGDKISGASSKKVQKRLNEYANADVKSGRIDRDFATHPGSLSYKGNQKVRDPKAKFPTARESVRYRKAEDKKDAAASARGLKAANKPTRASKSNEIKMVNKLAATNKKMGQKSPDATRNAARVYDQIRAVNKRAATAKNTKPRSK